MDTFIQFAQHAFFSYIMPTVSFVVQIVFVNIESLLEFIKTNSEFVSGVVVVLIALYFAIDRNSIGNSHVI